MAATSERRRVLQAGGQMHRRTYIFVTLGACGALIAGVIGLTLSPGDGTAAPVAARPEREVRDLDIAFYERRVAADSLAAGDRARLAGLYLRRARETGSQGDFERAEALARRSASLREGRNAQAFSVLASSLMAQHRFVDARLAAARLDSLEPGDPSTAALRGEIELELGNYDEAARLFGPLARAGDRITVAARLARWHELTGRLAAAQRVMAGARRRAAGRPELTAEERAWFDLRLGELALKRGDTSTADSAFTRGLATFPDDHRILAARARMTFMQGDWRGAIAQGERAIALQLDPTTLGVLSDAYRHLGDSARGRDYAAAMRVSALAQPGAIHRDWGLFLLDHGRDVDQVLTRARAELRLRRDVYGYDLVAWALYQRGEHIAAREAVRAALSAGTEDAMLSFHAGMIERALGNGGEARALLERALATNPIFHPEHAATARAVLDSLRAQPTATVAPGTPDV